MQKSKMNAFPNEAMWRDAIQIIETYWNLFHPYPNTPDPPTPTPKENIQAYPSISKLYYMLAHTQNYPNFT